MWQSGPSLLAPRTALGAAVLQGALYAVGGNAGGPTSLRTVERFDGQSWTSAPSMIYARQWHGAALGSAQQGGSPSTRKRWCTTSEFEHAFAAKIV